MRVRRTLLIAAAVGLLGTCAAVLVLGGFVVGNYELAPYHWYLHRVNDILFGQFFKRSSPNHRWVETIFLQLERDSGSVPVGREGTGGGLTSFGDAVVLVTHDGALIAARS